MAQLLEAGLILTLLGMGVVFALLTLLVGAVHAMSSFSRLFVTEVAADPPGTAPAVEQEIVGVVSAAIRIFRRNRSRKSTRQ